MKLKLLLAVILLASMSACAPQVLCPAYAIDDTDEKRTITVQKEDM